MKIAINTGGGDAPGLNAAIRAATLAALKRGWEVYGIKNGYGSIYTDEPFVELTAQDVRGITLQGGTILVRPIAAILLRCRTRKMTAAGIPAMSQTASCKRLMIMALMPWWLLAVTAR
ncbi:MAG: 6-phosphofructokinase [Fodinibius sp.]|nr:6-phosphofructokinase [Fodinibius sp.]